MTEDKARKKWCPRLHRDVHMKYSNGVLRERFQCIASECMAWRYTKLIGDGMTDDTDAALAALESVVGAAQEFCDRRDAGQVLSNYTYNRFKKTLAKLDPIIPEPEGK